jgi:predicted Zn finger-like uncharacterized protein
MILTCPACNTRYLADSEGFEPNGRSVRCTNCSHSWFQEAPQDGPKAVVVEDVETHVVRSGWPSAAAPTHSAPRERRVAPLLIGLLLAVAVLGGLLGAAYVYRDQVVRAWNPAQGLYAVIGIDVSTSGLSFRNTSYSRIVEEGVPVLVVEGILVNETDAPLAFRDVRASLRNSESVELDAWTFSAGEGMLEAGGMQIFETRRSNPPANAFDLELIILREDG